MFKVNNTPGISSIGNLIIGAQPYDQIASKSTSIRVMFTIDAQNCIPIIVNALVKITWARVFIVRYARERIRSEVEGICKATEVAQCKNINKRGTVEEVQSVAIGVI